MVAPAEPSLVSRRGHWFGVFVSIGSLDSSMLFRRKATASRATAGFVLIEVLVAVGVAAVLMAVLIRSFSQTWSGVNIVREEAEGTLLARSMMAAALQRDKLVPGSQEGTAGRYA